MFHWPRILMAGLIAVDLSGGVATAAAPPQPIREAAARVTFRQPPKPMVDSNADGAAIGALIGGAALGSVYLFFSLRCGEGCENDLPSWGPWAAVGLGVGGGTLAGFLIDNARRSTKPIDLTPAMSKHGAGVRFAIRF
jgi:hypothetical protein